MIEPIFCSSAGRFDVRGRLQESSTSLASWPSDAHLLDNCAVLKLRAIVPALRVELASQQRTSEFFKPLCAIRDSFCLLL